MLFTRILGRGVIQHRLSFRHDVELGDGRTTPRGVRTRYVRDISTIPRGATMLVFEDVIAVPVALMPLSYEGGGFKTLHSESTNYEEFRIVHTMAAAGVLIGEGYHLIDVHPELKEWLWVLGNAKQAEYQNRKPYRAPAENFDPVM